MQMGGWGELGIEKKTLIINNLDEIPAYLKGNNLNELYKIPATFIEKAPMEVLRNSAKLIVNISDLGTNASAEVFYGTEEGLTKEDKWQNIIPINVNLGDNTITLKGLQKDTNYFYRIRIKNDEGITWSIDTQVLKTSP
jgi:hypothetical protein